nr:MAG TPA: hypothetical protein [Caudoviricetes sp.]
MKITSNDGKEYSIRPERKQSCAAGDARRTLYQVDQLGEENNGNTRP